MKLKEFCAEFFYGSGELGARGRYVELVVDTAIILYFVGATFVPFNDWIMIIDMVIGVILIIEIAGRLIADSDRVGLISKPLIVLDVFIIISLFLPAFFGNFAFLRVIRALRVMRSYVVTRRLRESFGYFKHNEDVVFSAINLLVFIFGVTALVFVLQQEENESINNYIDALYFTVTTLTTTGFGDVILVGSQGRLLAILIMIVGVALFIRVVQTIFRPNKIKYECPRCGLVRHDLDSVHCKHCGQELHIRTEGMD